VTSSSVPEEKLPVILAPAFPAISDEFPPHLRMILSKPKKGQKPSEMTNNSGPEIGGHIKVLAQKSSAQAWSSRMTCESSMEMSICEH
jgi:hypothetical protein